MFNPRRMAVARKRRQMTKRTLAEKAGVSAMTLTRIEKGSTTDPEPGTIEAIARALRYPVEFFHQDDCEELKTESVSFRSLSAMTARQQESAEAAGTIAFLLDDWVTARLNLPRPDLLDLRHETPAAAAAALRNHWGIGTKPIPHLLTLLEAKGVRVFSLAEDNKNVDAFSCWRGETPYVFLNTFKSAERSRFDAAHELGHLVLHMHGATKSRDVEREADQFAAAFLIPKDDLVAHLPRVVSTKQLITAKTRWGVSVAALARNAFEADLVTEWHYRDLCRTISANGYRKKEPNPRDREGSVLWKKVFTTLWNDRMTKDTVARALHLPPDEIESLLGGLYGQVPETQPSARGHGLRVV